MLLGLIGSLGQDAPQSPAILIWKDVSSRYRGFDQIKPVLVNKGGESVFLSRIWPHGFAQLQRLNETTGKWESGDWGIGCGTVKDPTTPIEIKAHTERAIHVYWQLSADDWNEPNHFVIADSLEKRPLGGKYRFTLRYSLKPWTIVHHPGPIYTIVSPEFLVAK